MQKAGKIKKTGKICKQNNFCKGKKTKKYAKEAGGVLLLLKLKALTVL